MISVIICSKSRSLLDKVTTSIEETIGVPYEIIVIDNSLGKMGICEAYNKGAADAKFDYLCFGHEDVIYHTQGWGKNMVAHLEKPEIGVIGVCGCVIKPKSPSGAILFYGDKVNRTSMLQSVPNGVPYRKYDNPFEEEKSEVKILDGVFLACRKEVWEKNRFDQTRFPNFHGYDIDFSLQVSRALKNYVVYDILLEHFSEGHNNKAWVESVLALTEKWKSYLPASSQEVNRKELLKIEHKARHYFLQEAIKNRKGLGTLLPHFMKALFLWPSSVDNLRTIKRYIQRRKNYVSPR